MTLSAAISCSDGNHHRGLTSDPCSTSEVATTGTPGLIFELSDQDVLLGRGTGPNEAQGNIRFRALVRHFLQEVTPSKLDGKVKAKIARDILNAVKAENGRFLKTSSNGNSTLRCFSVVPDNVALDKIKQSFRHQLRVLEDAVSKRRIISMAGDDVASPVADGTRSAIGTLSSHYHRRALMTPSLASLLNTPSTYCLSSTSRRNLDLARGHLENEMMAKAIATQASAQRTLQDSARANALMATDRCVDSSPIAELVDALATAKATAALRQVSSLPYSAAYGGLASLVRSRDDASFRAGNSMISSARLGSRSFHAATSGLSELESRLATALALVGPGSHHRLQSDTPHFLDMILHRAS